MPLPVFLALQAVAGPALPVPDRLRATPRCDAERTGEDIVVCGRRDDPYRLKPLPERYQDTLVPRAETTIIGNVKGAVETEAAAVGGVPSKRVMARLKIPL